MEYDELTREEYARRTSAMIQRFEGYRAAPYDAGDGMATIGFGYTFNRNNNVALFDPAPTDREVETALRRVGLDSLADGGVHRALGAGGSGLSAGEAQLLALARVWLRNPDLVVLDEATARVDPATEGQLEAAIVEMMRGRTTVVIAHRLSTLRHVDEIVVLDHGRIVEHGARTALQLDDESRFHHLLQLAHDDDHDDDPGAGAVPTTGAAT